MKEHAEVKGGGTLDGRHTVEALIAQTAEAHYALYDANRAFNSSDPLSQIGFKVRQLLDKAALLLAKGKWYAGTFTGGNLYFAEHTREESIAAKAESLFFDTVQLCRRIEKILNGEVSDGEIQEIEASLPAVTVSRKDGEISFADDVPIVPSICPIVVLKGSSQEMGRQYIQQIIDIFGKWVVERMAARKFRPHELEVIRNWHHHMKDQTPEVCGMIEGWVDAAKEHGIELSYWSAVQLWTGHFEPIWSGIRGHGVRELTMTQLEDGESQASSSYLGGQSTAHLGERTEDLCSGACAWGDATPDGGLVAGSSTDHDCTFQVTIVAYPDTGNAFIYTPFSINGFIPGLGQYFFAGHPGMNDKGLAYVHHGGGLHGIEETSDRGYGLRRGASVFHNLRFADSTSTALENELSWPIGDVGTILGSVGGFYADSRSAYVCEARPSNAIGSTPILRELSFDESGRSYNFLYANNNSMHPRSSAGFSAPEQGYDFNVVEGWIQDKPVDLINLGEKQISPALSTKSSQGRNRYLFESMKAAYGSIDVDVMAKIYGTSAPERYREDGQRMSHREREVAWLNGDFWPSSICHRVNAFSAVMRPDHGDQGLYMGCVGPANRRAIMHIPGHGYYYYDEANEFWEIRLRNTPDELLGTAKLRAMELLAEAEKQVESVPAAKPGEGEGGLIAHLLDRAKSSLKEANDLYEGQSDRETDNMIRNLSRALRKYTTCQVRAKQVMTELGFSASLKE